MSNFNQSSKKVEDLQNKLAAASHQVGKDEANLENSLNALTDLDELEGRTDDRFDKRRRQRYTGASIVLLLLTTVLSSGAIAQEKVIGTCPPSLPGDSEVICTPPVPDVAVFRL